MKLSKKDIEFIRVQLDTWNNPLTDPTGTILSNSGIRNVSGIGNNLMNPTWGSADTLFPRVTYNAFDNGYSPEQGGFKLDFQTGAVNYDPNLSIDYSTRGTTIYDAQPRIISNLISNQDGLTNIQVQDDPSSTPGGRLSPLTGNDNPLGYSSYMTLFGQFFDHGLDFVHKGVDGNVVIPLLPGDSLYEQGSPTNFMIASRTNTVNVTIGEGSTDSLITNLGLADLDPNTIGNQTSSFSTVTGSTTLNANNSFSGTLVLNNQIIVLTNASRQGVVDAINLETPHTGVVASLSNDKLILTPASGESINTVSPYIDLSQSYGSAFSHTVFLREYDNNGAVTGRLVSGNADGVGNANEMSTWADIKANALKIGITLHDYNVQDVPMVRLNADGTTYFDANGDAWLVALNKTTGEFVYVQDTGKTALDNQNLVLMMTGHAFLDDMSHGVLSSLNENGDLVSVVDQAQLNAHFIAGDGRANENLGLTAIHDVFHAEHQRVLEDIKSLLTFDAVNNIYTDDAGKVWTGEDLFQAAKFVTEMEYQHMVFGEFARKLSPNINAFAAYDISIDGAISAEFAHAVYRFGHSMLTETIAMTGFGVDGISDGTDNSMGLIEAFLNPNAYSDTTAGEIAIGMSQQVGNAIDEWVTPALRDNLVGLPLDLAALNVARGNDAGIPTLNEVRQSLFDQTGMTNLKPYVSWDDFGSHLLHPEALKNFIMAYARDAILTQFGDPSVTDWNALQLSDPSGYAAKLAAAAELAMSDVDFMTKGSALGGNADFGKIDLWLGGLAEEKVTGGMLGSTFDFIFASQIIKLQNGDRDYYLDRLAGTHMLTEIESQLFSDIVMRNTGVKHLYSDIFSVADKNVELSDHSTNEYGSISALRAATVQTDDVSGISRAIGKAGYVGDTLYGNMGNYLDARGVFNPNGAGNSSEMLGGTEADNKINGWGGNDTIWGDGGNDNIEGGLGNDFLHGGDGNDVITDSEGADLIWGDAGNDSINGGNGLDQLFGGDGNDSLYGGLGADVVDGQLGNDELYGDNGTGASVTITRDINNIITGVTVTGVLDPTGDADVIQGGDGDDVLFGGGGNDALDGGVGNDWLIGGSGNDAMIGWDGDDHFIMDASDIGFNHAIDGGVGFDVVDYSASNGSVMNNQRVGVIVNLSNAGPAVVPVGVNLPDTYLSIEGLIGTQYDDRLIGGLAVQTDQAGNPIPLLDINGNPVQQVNPVNGRPLVDPVTGLPVYVTIAMNFSIDGGTGNDYIEGGDGNDTLIGGIGNDTVIGLLGNDILMGGDGNDSIDGGAGNDTLNGGLGNDILIGGAGTDTATYSDATGAVTVSLARTTAQNTGGAGSDRLTTIENIIGSIYNDILTGSNAANQISGGDGNDSIDGGSGNDTLNGGLGNDTILGGTGNDLLTGELGNDSIDGGTGNDTLNGGLGNDILIGGAGTDTATYSDATGAVTVSLASTTAQNTGGAGSDTLTTIENIIGSIYNDTLTGSNAANQISGDLGDDSIDGGAGNDTLNGGDGVDIINGGTGQDLLTGGAGSDTFKFAVGDSGITTATLDRISDYSKGAFGIGDLIDFSSNLTLGGNSNVATATQASINAGTGIATFAARSGLTLADAVNDIASRFTAATNTAGEFALFKVNNTGNYHMFISDGTAGAGANDVVIELVGVTNISSFSLDGGNLTITG